MQCSLHPDKGEVFTITEARDVDRLVQHGAHLLSVEQRNPQYSQVLAIYQLGNQFQLWEYYIANEKLDMLSKLPHWGEP